MKKKSSIKKQFRILIFGYSIVVLLAIVSVCLFLMRPSLRSIRQSRENTQQQVARNIEDTFKDIKQIAEGVGYNESVLQFLRSSDTDGRIAYGQQIANITDILGIADESLDAVYIYYDNDSKIFNCSVNPSAVSAIAFQGPLQGRSGCAIGFDGMQKSYMYYKYAVYEPDIGDAEFRKYIGTVAVVFDAQKKLAENELLCSYVITDGGGRAVMSNCSGVRAGQDFDKSGFGMPESIGNTENSILFMKNQSYTENYGIRMVIVILVMIVVCSILFFINNFWMYKKFLRPINTIVHEIRAMKESSENYILSEDIADNTECVDIVRAINFYVRENEKRNNDILEIKENIYRSEVLNKAMEAEYLKQQITPHFLYNILGCIRNMAMRSGIDAITDAITSLISILRYGTNSFQDVEIKEEIEIVKQYAALLNMRFANKIRIDVNAQQGVCELEIPRLLIQPIVENCIKHAYKDFDGIEKIDIDIKRQGEYICITVRDYGGGIEQGRLDKIRFDLENRVSYTQSIGIFNVNRRIKIIYGDDCGISITSKVGDGTCVLIKIKEIKK